MERIFPHFVLCESQSDFTDLPRLTSLQFLVPPRTKPRGLIDHPRLAQLAGIHETLLSKIAMKGGCLRRRTSGRRSIRRDPSNPEPLRRPRI